MIKEFTNLEKVDEIVEQAHEKRKELPVNSFRRYLIDKMMAEDSYIKIDTLEDRVVGFMFATVEEYNEEPVAFIHEAFTTEEGKTSFRDLLRDLELWSKQRELKNIHFVTMRNPKAWTRKYNFKRTAMIMTRRIQ